MSRSRTRAEKAGRHGETLAVFYLWLTGWRVLARRVRSARGEIDIVARRGNTLCFVEVKWRAAARELDRAITPANLRRIAAAAQAVGPRFARAADTQRIDVVLVAPGRWPRRLVNVWQPGA
ncbi:MAG: YraN family protein [Novosphingobium sp.]